MRLEHHLVGGYVRYISPYIIIIIEIQEWTKKNSLYKNVQTHIFEMWRHWMFLDVNKKYHKSLHVTSR